MGSRLGVMKIAAGRLGLSLEEYRAKRKTGLKWCWKCRSWRPVSQFNVDRSRGDGLYAACVRCRRVKQRKGWLSYDGTDQEKDKARHAIRAEIEHGKMPAPSELSCADCGDPAEVYHHYAGYAEKDWLNVVALCRSCHTYRHRNGEDANAQE